MKLVKREKDYEIDLYAENGIGSVLIGTIMQSEDAEWGFMQHYDGIKTLVLYTHVLRQIADIVFELEYGGGWEEFTTSLKLETI